MAKKKRRSSRKRGTPARVKAMVWLLVVLLVAGVAGVKFFQSARGQFLLLGWGFDGYYAAAQAEVDGALREAAASIGLADAITAGRDVTTVGRRRFPLITWRIACGEACDLVRVNLALTRAARSRGAVVLTSREEHGGGGLFLAIGRGAYVTHRISVTAGRGTAGRQERPGGTGPLLAIVIDDFGYSANGVVTGILALDLPVTCSVIPTLPYSGKLLERIGAAGKEALLHLPMEPEEKRTCDVPPVTTGMSRAKIVAMVNDYLAGMEGVVGINNHMGSKATQDERVMDAVLSVCRERGFFFLDSLTSPRSIAYNEAGKRGVKTARNDLFIDDGTRDPAVVEKRLGMLIERAKRRGTAIGIGHPHKWTLDALSHLGPRLERAGVRAVFLSALVR